LARENLDSQYNLVSWALNSFGVPLDDFLPGAKK
jgi:4-carboxymuconolactone decarboxylase